MAAAAPEDGAAATTTDEVNEKAAATEEEAAATTTNEVNEKVAATEEEAAATTTNEAAVDPPGNVGEVAKAKFDPATCPSGFTLEANTDLGFTTGGHTTEGHAYVCQCSDVCAGCTDSDGNPSILTAHVEVESDTTDITDSNMDTLVSTLNSKVASFVTTSRTTAIATAQSNLGSCEERARLGEGVGTGVNLAVFFAKFFADSGHWVGYSMVKMDNSGQDFQPNRLASSALKNLDPDVDTDCCEDTGYSFHWSSSNGLAPPELLGCSFTERKSCITMSVANEAPYYASSHPTALYKEWYTMNGLRMAIAADSMGGFDLLQAFTMMQAKGTSAGNVGFLGKRQGYKDLSNGLPGTITSNVGSETAQGVLAVLWFKVPGTAAGWTDLLGTPLTGATGQFRIEGSWTSSAYICQVKVLTSTWTGSDCHPHGLHHRMTGPIMETITDVDNVQENFVSMLGLTDVSTGVNTPQRRRRAFSELTYADCGSQGKCLPSSGSCTEVAKAADKYVRETIAAHRSDYVQTTCAARRRRTSSDDDD
jgi:hypothetical protein